MGYCKKTKVVESLLFIGAGVKAEAGEKKTRSCRSRSKMDRLRNTAYALPGGVANSPPPPACLFNWEPINEALVWCRGREWPRTLCTPGWSAPTSEQSTWTRFPPSSSLSRTSGRFFICIFKHKLAFNWNRGHVNWYGTVYGSWVCNSFIIYTGYEFFLTSLNKQRSVQGSLNKQRSVRD